MWRSKTTVSCHTELYWHVCFLTASRRSSPPWWPRRRCNGDRGGRAELPSNSTSNSSTSGSTDGGVEERGGGGGGPGRGAGGGAAAGQSPLGLHPEGRHRARRATAHHQGATFLKSIRYISHLRGKLWTLTHPATRSVGKMAKWEFKENDKYGTTHTTCITRTRTTHI